MARRSRRSTQRSRNRARNRARAQAAARSRRAAKSTQSQGNNTGRQSRGPNYAGLAKKLGVHPSVVKNQAAMRDRARERHTKFKQTRVQTFGGKKTSFSKAEQKRITDAGYSVKGYSKAPAQSNTQLQINKDNQMYGNTVPEGSFSISDAGKLQAEKNKAEAAAKAAAEKKAAAAAAKKEATRKSTFDPSRALNYAKGFNTLSVANMLAPEGGLSSYYMKGAKPDLTFNQAMKLENSMQQQTGKFDPSKKFNLASYARAESNPFRGMPGYGTVKSLVNPRIRNINYNRMLAGKPNLSMDKINPGGFQTAPTEGFRRLAPALGAFMPGYSIGSKLFNEGQTGSALDKSLKNVDNVNVGGLSIGFNSPESTDIGARVGKFFTSVPGKVANLFSGEAKAETTAGGLNIGGGVDSGETEGSKTARTLTARFNKPGLDTLAGGLDFVTDDKFDFDNSGKGLFGYGAVTPSNVINDAMSIAQNKNLTVKDMGTFLNTVKDISTSDDKIGTVKNILSNQDTTGRLLGPVYNQLRNSEIVDSLATKKLGLPDNYGEQLDQTKGALETAYSKLGEDDKANRRIISDLFIGKDPNLNLLKRGAEQFTNESGTIANYQDKTNLAKFQDSFKENSPLFKGLNKDERGLKGSLGNWRLSNLGTKIVGDNLEGTNNVADLASNIINTAGTNKATQSFVKTVQGGAPTVKSIIGGAIPKFGGRTGGSNIMNRLRSSAGSNATTLAAATPTSVEEVLPLPTTTTQTGTNAGNLASIMQNAYQNQMSLYGMNPNYSANFRQPRFNRPRKRFRQVFNRGYF